MAYQDLEERLQELNKLDFARNILDAIATNQLTESAITFKYAMAIANDFERNGVRDYAFVGGYAVLFHLLSAYGEDALRQWRGSTDVDLGARSYDFDSILRWNYHLLKKCPSHLTKNKIDYQIKDDAIEGSCVIDAYCTPGKAVAVLDSYIINKYFWSQIDWVKILGIQVPVASKMELLKMKLAVRDRSTGYPRDHDIRDAFLLCGLLEPEMNAHALCKQLPGAAQAKFAKVLMLPQYEDLGRLGLYVTPSTRFVQDLKKAVKSA